ncbi:MAG: acetyl-CoA carboxylase biotin carboxylase subunit [Ardenticatenia bacterium]|nr:acetyl-CoA carboxylase biotin carboxylase subunit [Ardenticatenia bacterium]
MLKKVLIANRGEIAVRIIRACHELGLETVAVYSEVDRNALHVRHAGEAYLIGPAPAAESYLRGDRLIEVALRSGADAIHPGYGFLAERAEFAEAVAAAGLTFVGPPPSAIRAMGDKVQSRIRMIAAGVPLVPGTAKGLRDDEAVAAAAEIGFPLLIKASAGGGGKGMRRVDRPQELLASLEAARRESQKAFGDDTVYLERLVEGARHIEIQVLSDTQGNVIHLGERECSLQRRHQKVLEECPSPVMTPQLRAAMGAAAVAAAKAVGYVSAGTVEFLVDKQFRFYFLEMNTRLQVEHPVTEMVTGVDLVKNMLRIAGGRPLRVRQEDITWTGHAVECRINAEDPFNNYLPSTGRITSVVEPTGPGVRIDSAIFEGAEVSLYYDPMLAKLIVHGKDRPEAMMRMRRALAEYHIAGVKTSIPLHQHLVNTTQVLAGNYDTHYLEEQFRMERPADGARERVAAIVATLLAHRSRGDVINRLAPVGSQVEWKLYGRRAGLRRL